MTLTVTLAELSAIQLACFSIYFSMNNMQQMEHAYVKLSLGLETYEILADNDKNKIKT